MIYLLASILSSTIIAVVFKLFPWYRIHLLSAIVINYFVCFACGTLIMNAEGPFTSYNEPWFPYAMFLGIFFISGFNLVGLTVEKFGIALATLMQKMSIVLSVSFAILYFHESLGWLKSTGLLLSLISIALYNSNVYKNRKDWGKMIWVPFLAWVISGIIEILLLYTQKTGLIGGTDASFTSHIFLFAGILGILYSFFRKETHHLWNRNNLIGGLLLGIPNFFSIYFLIKLLDTDWEGSVALPVNNIGILFLSSVLGVLLFREHNTRLQWIGLILALFSIFILSWSQ